jgi:predicted anti-sigma-YlaC factor YlaD
MSDHKHTNMTCDQLLGYLSDYLDGQTRDEVCREIEHHMSECQNCRVVVDTTRKTISLVHACNDTELSLPDEVRERLFKRLNLDDYLRQQNAP